MNRNHKTYQPLLVRIAGKITIIMLYTTLFVFFLYLPTFLTLFSNHQSLNVCVFSETFTPESILRFEQETGIKVNITYAEIDEQIYAKFRMNGADGYDVVNMSDYVVHALRKQDLLVPIDKSKITSLVQLDEKLLNRVYDVDNQVSLPHKWYVYGLVYDKQVFNIAPEKMSLDYIFNDPAKLVAEGKVSASYRVCMLDDARDAVFMAGIYLFGRGDEFSEDQLQTIRKLLIAQKRWTEAYTLHSAQYFLFSGVTPIALMSSNYMRKIYQHTDRYAFAIPKEGSMLIIENLVIPKKSSKVDLAHKFIDFMLSESVAKLNAGAYGFNSANKLANEGLVQGPESNLQLLPDASMFKRLFIPLLPGHMRKRIEDLWLTVCFA